MLTLPKKDKYLVGVISDTHGLLRPGVKSIFKEADLIVHAGDVGRPVILETLETICPVAAVRGNMDQGHWARKLPVKEAVEIGDALIYILHNLYELDLEPSSGFHAVISGHTHRPCIEKKNGVIFLNPGSAGPRRFDYPISVALLHVKGTSLEAQIIEIKD